MPDWETVKASLPIEKSATGKRRRIELWNQFNVTNPSSLSLLELDAGIQKVLRCEELFRAKGVILRAYKYAREINPGGPDDSLEFCEFRLLLVYLKGLMEVFQVFSEIDGSRDMALSLEELQSASEKFGTLGLSVPDATALWEQLRGSNDSVEFGEFADWAVRQGMAGPELLEVELANDKAADEDLAYKLKGVLRSWTSCKDGLVQSEDIKGLLWRFLPELNEDDMNRLVEGGVASEDGRQVSVDNLIDSIILSEYL
eukprot:CAMPEP_0179122496 /NCGR_PEP_ID=MMETSP0796-20121207/57815_1 /TAXON_ID=73915 /ORGANISM="Pyrodinium bahamense, Strain pbaha01" /LENGTH=256 /DNA_ID=CAMNT_0020821119 /DNA_START=9 /DNA_END=779 /DNA_ORIENTATION=-